MKKNHYELAFEAYLRNHQLAYIAIDETKRSLNKQGSLKNFDFVVVTDEGKSCLVDVKGRKFPAGQNQKRYWLNWVGREDLRSQLRWQEEFGEAFEPMFVFAYWVVGERSPVPVEELFYHRNRWYGFVSIGLRDYLAGVRVLSLAWETFTMSVQDFREKSTSLENTWFSKRGEIKQRAGEKRLCESGSSKVGFEI